MHQHGLGLRKRFQRPCREPLRLVHDLYALPFRLEGRNVLGIVDVALPCRVHGRSPDGYTSRRNLILHDILHVPDARTNVMGMTSIDDYAFTIGGGGSAASKVVDNATNETSRSSTVLCSTSSGS
jgi:hypothetical protein